MNPFSPMMSPGMVEQKSPADQIEITAKNFIEASLEEGWSEYDIADMLQLDIKDIKRLIRIYKIKI